MSARKHRPVLYEVIRHTDRSSDPTVKPHPQDAPPPAVRSSSPGLREPEVMVRPSVAHAASTTPAPGGRLTLSRATLAVIVAAIVVLMFVAFSAGRKYEASHPSPTGTAGIADTGGTPDGGEAHKPDAAGTGTATATTKANHPVSSASQKPKPGSEKPAAAGPRVTLQKGYHYVIVQHFGKRRQAAIDAATYLRKRGVACAILPGKDIRLIATEPFLIKQDNAAAGRREKQRASRYMERIRAIGKQLSRDWAKANKRGYTLEGCYLYEFK